MSCNKEICCCKCSNQIEVMKHPSNDFKGFKGSITDHFSYACLIAFDQEDTRKAYLFDRKHDECEMFNPKKL